MWSRNKTLLCLYVLAEFQLGNASFLSVPLSRHTSPSIRHISARSPDITSTKVFEYRKLWFANYTIGNAPSLSLIIDTGSADIILNMGKYLPSASSHDLNKTVDISFGTTSPDGTGAEEFIAKVFEDDVCLAGSNLAVSRQSIAVQERYILEPPFPNPQDGIIGFQGNSSTLLGSSNWFQSLCDSHTFDECRFGLALGTDDTGTQYLGGVAKDSFVGEMSTVPISEPWTTWGDIVYNGTVFDRGARMFTDSGTAVIFGPIEIVQKLFDAAGMETVARDTEIRPGINTTILTGYYPCSEPPSFGFGLPSLDNITQIGSSSDSAISNRSSIFNVQPHGLAQNSTDGNCSSSIYGAAGMEGLWIVGQPLFQGHYIDHNFEDNTMGFAKLA